jgi:PadR family transcriptional regulator PadR
MFTREQKKGNVELLILSMLTDQPRHGYEIGKLIELRSGGQIHFRISSLYPVLSRMEAEGWVTGQWVEKGGERRRCYYRLTGKGKNALAEKRRTWKAFVSAMDRAIGVSHA